MLSAIYKSTRKVDTYLFVEKRDDFSKVPEALLNTFGKPVFVMLINIGNRENLAGADIKKVKHQFIIQSIKNMMLRQLKKQSYVHIIKKYITHLHW